MGFFSGIGDAIKGVTGAISEPISALSGIMGIAAPFMEQSSVSSANAVNQQLAREQMQFQREQNQKAMDFGSLEAGKAWERNAIEAQTGRNFAADMANSTYQRAVLDMSKAGLNPMLAVSQGGAPSPVTSNASGSAATGASSAGAMARVDPTFRAQSVASANQARVLNSQISNVNADTANKLLSATNIQADTQLKGGQAYKELTQGHVNQATEDKIIRTVGPLLDQIRANTNQSAASASQIESQNLAIKDLMSDPATRRIAPALQLLLQMR